MLEASTPECRSPWDLLVYQRSFDYLLEEISRQSAAALGEKGFPGRLAFGKNNVDSSGVGFGCHENYLVHHDLCRREKALYFVSLPVVALTLLPAALVLLGALSFWLLGQLLARFLPVLRGWATALYERLRHRERLRQNLVAAYQIGFNALLFPAIWVYTHLLRLVAFRPFTRQLPSFLISRQILCGSGFLNFGQRAYEISQRAHMTTSLSDIIMFGRGKTIFDFKGLLYSPRSILRPTKKLSLTFGDSNLSDLPTLLKIGTTALILEMIENGETFADLRLRRPIRAFRLLSLGGPWKQLDIVGGKRRSAVDLQREYLARARRYFAERPRSRVRHGEILDLWEETLERLADRPQSLSSSVDWLAKKSLLDGAILARSDWKTFFQWGELFFRAGMEPTCRATDLEDLLARLSRRARRAMCRIVSRSRLAPEEFGSHRDLYLQARKIDLRYHEIGDPGGYQRSLENGGLSPRLTVDEDVEKAIREPPHDTRARVRGYYIRLSAKPEAVQASWGEVELLHPFRRIALPDPFFYRLPGDD